MSVTYVIVVNDNGALVTITEYDIERYERASHTAWKYDVDGCIERVLDFMTEEKDKQDGTQ